MRVSVKLTVVFALFTASMAPAYSAKAGIYGDDLSRCLVEHTSENDKIMLAQWIFTVISVHPSASSLATVSENDRADVASSTALIFQQLLTDFCRSETSKAVKYEGDAALTSSFEVLGQIAMSTLLADPTVAAESQNFIKYVDEEKLNAVFNPSSAGG